MDTRTRISSFLGSHTYTLDFEAVYKQELPRVYNFFRYRVGDDNLAEDLTAETFEKAWRGRHQYRRDLAAFSTWLFTIARRVFVDHLRKQRSFITLDALNDLPANENTEDMVNQKVAFARLTTLLSQLADRDRELVALRYGAGLTNRTIARLTGLSESNIGVLLHRAVQKLREEWENHE
jgi:RNA polymerase sigma-70 factor (ECF subfamily)